MHAVEGASRGPDDATPGGSVDGLVERALEDVEIDARKEGVGATGLGGEDHLSWSMEPRVK